MKLTDLRKPLIWQVFSIRDAEVQLYWAVAVLRWHQMAASCNSLRPDDLEIQKILEAGSSNLHSLAVGSELDLVLMCQFLCAEAVWPVCASSQTINCHSFRQNKKIEFLLLH